MPRCRYRLRRLRAQLLRNRCQAHRAASMRELQPDPCLHHPVVSPRRMKPAAEPLLLLAINLSLHDTARTRPSASGCGNFIVIRQMHEPWPSKGRPSARQSATSCSAETWTLIPDPAKGSVWTLDPHAAQSRLAQAQDRSQRRCVSLPPRHTADLGRRAPPLRRTLRLHKGLKQRWP